MRTQYTIKIIDDTHGGGIGFMLVDGYDGGEFDRPYTIFEPRLLAHDILEHVPGPEHIGPVDDELQALGTVLRTRPEVSDSLKYDVYSVCLDDYDGEMFTDCPEVSILDEVVRDEIRRAAYLGVRMYQEEQGEWVPTYYTLYRTVVRHMSYGYVRACAHYADVAVCDMFHRITEQAKMWSANWLDEGYVGYTFKVTLDWNETECYIGTQPNEWEIDYDE